MIQDALSLRFGRGIEEATLMQKVIVSGYQ